MVTGHKFMELTTSNTSHIQNKLSILIAQDGFSFCAGSKENRAVEYFYHKSFLTKQTPENLLKEIKTVLQFDFFEKNKKVNHLDVIYSNTLYTLVPNAFFVEKQLADYLKFNTKILATDDVTFDDVDAVKAKNVYIPYTNINNFLFEHFGSFSFKHISSTLINQFAEVPQKTKVLVHVYPTHFYVIVFKNDTLHLTNSFIYQSKEDFIYYILFVLEQLDLDPLNTPIYLSGDIEKEDSNYQILSTYVQEIHFFEYDISNIYFAEKHLVDTQKHNLLISQF